MTVARTTAQKMASVPPVAARMTKEAIQERVGLRPEYTRRVSQLCQSRVDADGRLCRRKPIRLGKAKPGIQGQIADVNQDVETLRAEVREFHRA